MSSLLSQNNYPRNGNKCFQKKLSDHKKNKNIMKYQLYTNASKNYQ